MVDYIGIEAIQKMMKVIGVAPFIKGLASEIESDYKRWASFDKSPRHAIHSAEGVIELMPTSDGHLYSFKYVNGHPKNTANGLLTVTAFGVLADVDTGYPLLLSELTVTTALRTAAMSCLAAQWMARKNSRIMALIGNGSQSEFQALGFYHLLGIRELRLYDVDLGASRKLKANLEALSSQLPGLTISVAPSVAQAVKGADIVTTVTADKRNAIILTPEMIEPGMHLNAVGGDCPGKTELHADILLRPDAKVIVEFEPQSRIEGELQQMPADFKVCEFAHLVSGQAKARLTDADVTIFDSVGFALEDFSALRYLHQLLKSQKQTAQLDLVPNLADPKNLFSLLLSPETAATIASKPSATIEDSSAILA
jgi:ornithine cyclodeaminase